MEVSAGIDGPPYELNGCEIAPSTYGSDIETTPELDSDEDTPDSPALMTRTLLWHTSVTTFVPPYRYTSAEYTMELLSSAT